MYLCIAVFVAAISPSMRTRTLPTGLHAQQPVALLVNVHSFSFRISENAHRCPRRLRCGGSISRCSAPCSVGFIFHRHRRRRVSRVEHAVCLCVYACSKP
uniref:Putative secreted protein n=1 Tax=Anopheles triannulatus TaxID=58253 RepID=A0A2M4B437_9DIPT